MGHSYLGYLPQTFEWQDLIGQIAGVGDAQAVAEATLHAADDGLRLAARDPGLKYVVLLLMQVPLAARGDDFALGLQDVAITVAPSPTLFDLLGGFAEAVDGHLLASGNRTDFGEMAQMAAAEALAAVGGGDAAGLWGTTAEVVKLSIRKLSTERGFSTLAHTFFSRFIQRFITYHLSRELSAHVGPGRRFANVDAHTEFGRQLGVTSDEVAVIVKTFAGQWFGKAKYETGITPERARDFVHGAFAKIRKELGRRGGAHAA